MGILPDLTKVATVDLLAECVHQTEFAAARVVPPSRRRLTHRCLTTRCLTGAG